MVNRTVQLANRSGGSGQLDADAVGGLAETQRCLAATTRELGEFLEQLANERFEFLYQAEEAMLASAGSLEKRDFPQGTVQQKDAVVYLIKARDKIRQVLRKSDPNALQAFRNFDRTQLQKLRRPKDEGQQSEELAARLRQLSGQEQIVYATLGGIKLAGSIPEPGRRKPGQRDPSKQGGPQGSQGQEGASAADSGPPQTAAKRAKEQPGETDRREVEKLQQEIVNEAYDIARIIKGLDELPDLAGSRMEQAMKKAEEVSSALARGSSAEAAQAAGEAVDMFKELARQVEGLLGREAAQRIAAARDISAELARRERELGDAVPGATPPPSSPQPPSRRRESGQKGQGQRGPRGRGEGTQGNGQPSKNSDTAGYRAPTEGWSAGGAARLAETGRTLESLLETLANPQDGANADLATQIERLLREGKVTLTVQQMQQLEGLLLARRWREARTNIGEIAARLEALSQRLDTLHRSVVAPRLAALIALEKRAADLRERLGKLSADVEISAWHRDAEALTRDLPREPGTAPRGSPAADHLLEAMREAGWGSAEGAWHWERPGPYYVGPEAYYSHLGAIVEGLQSQVYELLLGDLIAAGDEAVPPEYEKLVERYFQTLSENPGSQ